MKNRVTSILVFAALTALSASILMAQTQTPRSPETMFEAATKMALIDGDLEAAIGQYKAIVAAYPGRRAVVAEALVRMGQTWEKLGRKEAQQAYQQVVSDYADQREQAGVARSRLAALEARQQAGGADSGSGPTIQRLQWQPPSGDPYLHGPSPDGRYYSYIEWDGDDASLSVQDMSAGQTHRLTQHDGFPYSSVISRDSRQVAFVWWHAPGQMDVRTIAMDGTGERVLFPARGIYPEVHDWSPDGTTILTALRRNDGSAQIVLVSANDGSSTVVKTLLWGWPEEMQFSPDGRFIAYDLPPDSDTQESDIYLLATDGSREVHLVEHVAEDHRPYWKPDGSAVIFSSDRTGSTGLWQIDVSSGRPVGAPELVLGDFPHWPRGLAEDGTLYFLATAGSSDTYVATLDLETGELIGTPESLDPRRIGQVGFTDFSLDERFASYELRGEDHLLIVRDLESGEEHEVAPDIDFSSARPHRISPDGRSILLLGQSKGRSGLFNVDVETGKAVSALDADDAALMPSVPMPTWTDDGKGMFYISEDSEGGRLLRKNFATGEAIEVARVTRSYPFDLTLSPNGRFLAYTEARDDARALMVVESSGGVPRRLFTGNIVGWGGVAWTPDSEQLLFIQRDPATGEGSGAISPGEASLWKIPAIGGEPEQLQLRGKGLMGLRLHPDGERLMFSAGSNEDFELWAMQNFLRPADRP